MMMLNLDVIRLHLLNDFRLTTPNDSQARDACRQALAQVIAEDEQLRAEVERLRRMYEPDVRRRQAERETEG